MSDVAVADTRCSVVVVGSLHHDIVVGAADRPRKGETLPGRWWRPVAGGKGRNQAVAAAEAGARVAMVGAVGRDAFGAALLASLDAAGIDRTQIVDHPDLGSGMSVAILDDEGDYGAVIVSGANLALDAAFIAAEGGAIDQARILVLQNEIPDAGNVAAAKRARSAGALTILNAAPARDPHPELPDLVDLLVVNAVEAEMLGTPTVATLEDASAAAARLLGRYRAVVVTAGAAGVAYAHRDGSHLAVPALPVRVSSTHGAGDRFVGTLAVALGRGAATGEALAVANASAAAWVSRPAQERSARS